MTETENKVVAAFQTWEPKCYGFNADGEGVCVVEFNGLKDDFTVRLGEWDEFNVSVKNGRIEWIDFTHTTDLGPVDGSELKSRMEEWEVANPPFTMVDGKKVFSNFSK